MKPVHAMVCCFGVHVLSSNKVLFGYCASLKVDPNLLCGKGIPQLSIVLIEFLWLWQSKVKPLMARAMNSLGRLVLHPHSGWDRVFFKVIVHNMQHESTINYTQ